MRVSCANARATGGGTGASTETCGRCGGWAAVAASGVAAVGRGRGNDATGSVLTMAPPPDRGVNGRGAAAPPPTPPTCTVGASTCRRCRGGCLESSGCSNCGGRPRGGGVGDDAAHGSAQRPVSASWDNAESGTDSHSGACNAAVAARSNASATAQRCACGSVLSGADRLAVDDADDDRASDGAAAAANARKNGVDCGR